MGRELKFRAWDEPTDVNGPTGMSYDARPDCDATAIMQFTGLKDVNGVEIYEGDVVKGQRYLDRPGQFARFIGAVEYDPWWGAYRRKGVKQYQGLDADLRHGRELEVIGNIYQNPELTEPQ